jgi:hypothetical protein
VTQFALGFFVGVVTIFVAAMWLVASKKRKSAKPGVDAIRAKVLAAEKAGKLVDEFQRFRLRIALLDGPMTPVDNQELTIWLDRLQVNNIDAQAQMKRPVGLRPAPPPAPPSKRAFSRRHH